MTDTSSFFTTHQTRDVPRDQWGRYELPDPVTGEKMTGWTRATTFAATMAEQYGLSIWHQRQVVWGLARRPDLLTMAQTIAGPEDKKALGAIVDEAHIAAGTKAKANRGTAIHSACHAAEVGAFEQVPDEMRPHVAGYFKALKEWRLEVIPEYVERTVIVPEYHVAGTFDNLLRCPDGKIRVGDKKTGREDYSDVEWAIQMSMYANAKYIFNYDTNRYEPMPEVAKDYAILMLIDPETGVCTPKRINIRWGWAWAMTSAQVMEIRKTKNIITPMIPWDDTEISPGLDAAPRSDFTTAGVPIPVDPPIPYLNNGNPQDYPARIPDEDQFAAFWNQPFGDDDPDETVNSGVPSQWGCARGEPCEFTGNDGLHTDGTVCLYGNARPGPIPPMPAKADLAAAALEAQQPNATPQSVMAAAGAPVAESNVDSIAAAMNKLSKAHAQTIALEVMGIAGTSEEQADGIKLSQYKSKIVNATISLAYRHGIEIPGVGNAPPFGTPTGPAPTDSASGSTAQKAPAARSGAEVAADPTRDEKVRTAVESIRMQESVAGLQERHDYYTKTSLGWTDEMQNAARTRAAELDNEAGESPLSPLEMIQGATTRETLTKAWEKATGGGADMNGWTEELNAAAMAKQTELSGGTQ